MGLEASWATMTEAEQIKAANKIESKANKRAISVLQQYFKDTGKWADIEPEE
jgi:hypothetical protein